MKRSTLPSNKLLLQSAYLDFVISAYVDLSVEESATDIDNVWHCYISCVRVTNVTVVKMKYYKRKVSININML